MQPRRVAVPPSPFARAVKAFLSLLLMLGLVGGLPVALLVFAGNPIPAEVPTLDGIGSALTSPDDGTLFLDVLAVVGWLAWGLFTLSLLLELVARMFRRKAPSIFGLRSTQRVAGVLVAAVAAVAVTPTVTGAHAAVVQAPAPVTAPVDPSGVDRLRPAPASDSVLHLVERGEGLLDLQEKYGVPWQRIAAANYDKQQPDGRALTRGQTRIYPGWQLTIPASTTRPTVADTANPQVQEYEVARGDWLWHISERYLGDPERYPEIAELNPQYEQRNAEFPDHIEPGWTLELPEEAEDRGPIEHATGTATPEEPPEGGAAEQPPPPEAEQPPPPEAEQPPPPEAEQPAPPEAEQPAPPEAEQPRQPPERQPEAPPAPEQPQPPVSSGFGQAPELPAPAPPQATGLGEAPGQPEQPRAPAGREPVPEPAPQPPPAEETGDGFSSVQPDLERLAPAALAGAGLLTALVLGAAGAALYRRNQHHRSGFRVTSPTARRLEKVLRAAQQPLDATRLDAALRNLAAGLTGRTTPLPDIAGAMVDEGSVHLLLAAPCADPPPPWQDHGERWTLPAGAPLPPPSGVDRLAPLPMLAAIGSQAGIHLLLDLERLGFLTIYGDPGRALDLLRYLAAELACNSWSDAAEVLLAGFDPRQAELLTTLNPNRVRAVPSIPDAVALLRHRIASARATLGHTGAPDALAGRINGVAADAWMPQILLASAASPADLAALAALERELDGTARCAVAVATTDATPPPPDHARVTVTPDAVVHVRLPFLRAQLAAASLTTEELAPLAETMRAARTAPQVPVPPAAESEPWAIGTDAAGAARSVGQATVGATWFQPGAEPPTVPVPTTVPYLEGDPSLDEDLREWHAEQSARPRIGILGPVSIRATGTEPETRRRLHAELLVFLAQRAGRGADAGQIDAALWPDLTVTDSARQLFISRARRWLGTTPDGAQWLPDVGADLVYRLADGYLFDWHLFRRLRTRADARGGEEATADLRAALELVRGLPLEGADHPAAPGTRNPYPWLAESDVHPHHLVAAIVDVAHQLAERYLAAGDPAGARWAVQQAWLADTARSFDHPWRDMLRAEHADGHTDRMRAVLAELMEAREAEAPEDLSPETYSLVSCWPPHVLVPSAQST